MSEKKNIIASGDRVILRDRLPSDVGRYIHWQTHGEWREYDAPWEGVRTSMTEEKKEKFRKRFLEQCEQEMSTPRRRATVVTREGKPLGWVNRYVNERFPDAWFVGIDICEDEYLNKGVGTETLEIWIAYLFSNSDIHRIGLDTWSLNERMIRVAEKLGFTFEGAERELIEWQGEWLDRVHFGMLRREWEARKS
jgi:RimJ/RimL family protein N-acetyltransferase